MKNFIFTGLSTERLLMRRLAESDLEPFVAYRADPQVAKYQSWENFLVRDGKRLIQEQSHHDISIPDTWFQIALELKTTGELIGDLAVHTLIQDPQQVEIGFTFARAFQGQGFATESVTALLNYLFADLKKHRVIAVIDVRNERAIKLLERLKFRREGHFLKNIWYKGSWGDEYLYALLREEWEKHMTRQSF